MKKSIKYPKKIKIILIVSFIIMFFVGHVFAVDVGDPDRPSWPESEDLTNSGITVRASMIWNTFENIAQILAIGAIVFAGIRYMFSSADNRADIKIQTVILVFGGAIVFAAVPLIKFIVAAINELI